jgi:hypothetical protein
MTSFDTVESLLEYVQNIRARAQESLKDSRYQSTDFPNGTYFFNWAAYESHGILVFGCVMEPQPPDPEDEEAREDYEAEVEYDRDNRSVGYVFGRFFSIVVPNGELGSVHVTRLVPVSKDIFERARANGWRNLNQAN